jgi:hypothetical protein
MDTYLTISAQPLGIPYHREASEPGSASYIDLRSEPHRLAEIPEVQERDCFRRLLVRLNSPDSQLMSLGCGAFIYPPEQASKPFWSAYAYVGYCFADLAKNEDAKAYFPQFFHFTQHYRARTEQRTSVFFDLRPTGFRTQNAQGFSVDFIVKAWAESQPELDPLVTQHMDALYDFLPLMGLVPNT